MVPVTHGYSRAELEVIALERRQARFLGQPLSGDSKQDELASPLLKLVHSVPRFLLPRPGRVRGFSRMSMHGLIYITPSHRPLLYQRHFFGISVLRLEKD